jgi:DNA polymerase-3 subunit gamma/tau
MDRLIASGEKKLTPATLQELLGLPDHDVVMALVDALAEGDAAAALAKADELLRRDSGDQLLETLAAHFRDLMVLAACGPETELVELAADARRRAADQASRFDPAGLVHMIAICESVQQALRSTSTPRALVDAAIVRLAMTEKLADVTAIVTGSAAVAAHNGAAAPAGAPAKKR